MALLRKLTDSIGELCQIASPQQQICAIAVLLLDLKGKLQRRIFKRWQ
jgi:hypothetical protein